MNSSPEQRDFKRLLYGLLALFAGLFIASFFLQGYVVEQSKEFIHEDSLLSVVIFVLLIFLSTVFAPLTVFPIVPLAAPLLGSAPVAIYSIVGWWLGALAAFLIARNVRKNVLSRFVSLGKIERYERYMPKEHEFWWVLLLRMIVPVDVLSYAIGLFSTITFGKYALATLIGIMPFAFILAYAGSAAFSQEYTRLVLLAGVGLFILGIGYYVVRHKMHTDT